MDKKYIDLFAGCGGLSLGIEKAGFTISFANDIDSNSMKTYALNRNLNKSQMYVGDISNLLEQYEKFNAFFSNVDLVCGGPPCQGFSMANRQRLLNDPRNILYKQYLLFLQKVEPKFFIMENVKGMLNKMGEILSDMNSLLNGMYNISYAIFNAKDYGVPQNRERLIIIGNKIHISSEKIIDEIKQRATNMPHFTLRDAISDLPELKPNRIKNNNVIENCNIGFRSVKYKYIITDYFRYINENRHIPMLHNHKNRYNNDRDIEIFSRLPQGENSLHKSIADIMPYQSRNGIFKDKYYKLKYDDVCKTITSHMKFDCNMYIHPTQSRGLSPREAARIQTFPDDYVFFGPQNDWYKQIGNAVPPKFAQVIGEEIIKYL